MLQTELSNLLKAKNKTVELMFLKDTFVIHEGKIERIVSGEVKNSNIQELQKALDASKDHEVKIDLKALETLKKMYGDFDLVQ